MHVVWFPTFIKMSSFVSHRRTNVIRVWKDMRVSKWWQNCHFWVDYPFKPPQLKFVTASCNACLMSYHYEGSGTEGLLPSPRGSSVWIISWKMVFLMVLLCREAELPPRCSVGFSYTREEKYSDKCSQEMITSKEFIPEPANNVDLMENKCHIVYFI